MSDHDRPLAKRGRRDIPRIAEYAVKKGLMPQLILSSTAERTRETTELFTATAGGPENVVYTRDLYLATAREIIAVVATVPAEIESVMLVGHNPGLADVVHELAGGDVPHQKLSTGALVCFAVEVDDWGEVRAENVRLTEFIRPKDVK